MNASYWLNSGQRLSCIPKPKLKLCQVIINALINTYCWYRTLWYAHEEGKKHVNLNFNKKRCQNERNCDIIIIIIMMLLFSLYKYDDVQMTLLCLSRRKKRILIFKKLIINEVLMWKVQRQRDMMYNKKEVSNPGIQTALNRLNWLVGSPYWDKGHKDIKILSHSKVTWLLLGRWCRCLPTTFCVSSDVLGKYWNQLMLPLFSRQKLVKINVQIELFDDIWLLNVRNLVKLRLSIIPNDEKRLKWLVIQMKDVHERKVP